MSCNCSVLHNDVEMILSGLVHGGNTIMAKSEVLS